MNEKFYFICIYRWYFKETLIPSIKYIRTCPYIPGHPSDYLLYKYGL